MRYLPITLVAILFLILGGCYLVYGKTNEVIEAGIKIKSMPVVEVSMPSNNVYTVWHTDTLSNAQWEVIPMFSNFYAKSNYKAQVASSEFGTTGFFWLQVNGDTNFPVYMAPITNGIPPMPGGN